MERVLYKTIVAAGILGLGLAGSAWAQEEAPPPERGVARVSIVNGEVSLKRGDSGDYVEAGINAPLSGQDRLITGDGSRAEVQFDSSNMVRLAPNTEIRLAEIQANRYQIQIPNGTITFRVLRDEHADVEISTPSISVRPVTPGIYRVTVHPDGTSEITVRAGEADIYTARGSERLRPGSTMLARGNPSDPEFQYVGTLRDDEWDYWNNGRDRQLEESRSYNYVSRDIYGAEDLDANGQWVSNPEYGNVWSPNVGPDWAPYRNGRWAWMDYYGWTWVSYDPWGWAPYHYGRWFYASNRWCWYPGPAYGRHYWSPALVAFFGFGHGGGVGVGFGFGNIGWVPLGPREVYRPWYGRGYYSGYRNVLHVDNSINIINNVNIRNTYVNARVGNGITGVDANSFGRGRVVSTVRVNEGDLRQAAQFRGQLPVAPGRESLRFTDRTGSLPRGAASDATRFASRRQPAAVDRVPFDQQRQAIDSSNRRTFGSNPQPAYGRQTSPQPAYSRGDSSYSRSGSVVTVPQNSAPVVRAPQQERSYGRGESSYSRGAATDYRQSNPAPPVQAPQQDRTWRRFGDPGRPSSYTPPVANQNNEPSNYRGQSAGSWSRFGGGGSAPSQPVRSYERPAPRAEVQRAQPQPQPQMQPRQTYRTDFGRSEQMRISPPIVRERSAPVRSESPRSAPAPRGDNGGGRGNSHNDNGGRSADRGSRR